MQTCDLLYFYFDNSSSTEPSITTLPAAVHPHRQGLRPAFKSKQVEPPAASQLASSGGTSADVQFAVLAIVLQGVIQNALVLHRELARRT